MNRLILSFAALLLACYSYGQDPERKMLIYANGAYSQKKTDYSNGTMHSSTERKAEKISLGMSGKINSFFYVGLGLSYEKSRENNDYTIDNLVNPANNYAFANMHLYFEESKITPTVNLKFFKNLTNRLSTGLNVITGYEFTKRIDESFMGIIVSYPDNFIRYDNNESDKQGISLKIQPELVYYVSDWVGISAEFNFYTYDAIHASQFIFATNSNDIMWSLGIVFPVK